MQPLRLLPPVSQPCPCMQVRCTPRAWSVFFTLPAPGNQWPDCGGIKSSPTEHCYLPDLGWRRSRQLSLGFLVPLPGGWRQFLRLLLRLMPAIFWDQRRASPACVSPSVPGARQQLGSVWWPSGAPMLPPMMGYLVAGELGGWQAHGPSVLLVQPPSSTGLQGRGCSTSAVPSPGCCGRSC